MNFLDKEYFYIIKVKTFWTTIEIDVSQINGASLKLVTPWNNKHANKHANKQTNKQAHKLTDKQASTQFAASYLHNKNFFQVVGLESIF